MVDFEVWLKTVRSCISTKSRLCETLNQIAKYMEGLKLAFDDGTVEMDSNIVEWAMPHCIEQKRSPVRGPRRRLQNISTHRVSGKFYTNFSTVTLRFTTALRLLKQSSALSGNRALKGLPGKARSPTLCCVCGQLALWFIAPVVIWRLWLRFVG